MLSAHLAVPTKPPVAPKVHPKTAPANNVVAFVHQPAAAGPMHAAQDLLVQQPAPAPQQPVPVAERRQRVQRMLESWSWE